ncbi:VgrG-related protein [Streptomyces sp. NPDC047981]|uniref:VgrG-related protein n=1 Tax=Streptomyces sp. NPDC047981 TaxID=3154610 RepID=UPI003435E9FD
MASVRIGQSQEDVQQRVVRAVVDSRVNMPTMIEVTFTDTGSNFLADSGITFGSRIEVATSYSRASDRVVVGAGEVTSVEADCFDGSVFTIVRAYDRSHLLQRGSRVRDYIKQKDSDIAKLIAGEAGLPIGEIKQTTVTHEHLGQMNQTDWEFLTWRCREIGYEFGVDQGKFFFRPAATAKGSAVRLELLGNLRTFRPRITAGNMAPEVEMRVWDPLEVKAVSTRTRTVNDVVDIGAEAAEAISGVAGTKRPTAAPSGAPSQDPAPSADGRILTDRAPAAGGGSLSAASRAAVEGPARRLAGSFAEAQAETWGDPALQAGATVEVVGVPKPFAGSWTVVAAQHVFDLADGGYRTRLQLGNGEDRTLLGLTAGDGGLHSAPRVNGLVCGVVTDVNDPLKKGRVKVKLPWLAPSYVTDWAPVVQAAGGRRAGALLLPEVEDQVLLGFELGDPRRPYVVGGVLSNASTYKLSGPAVEATGDTAEVVRRGIVSPAGNMLEFHDKVPAPNQPPTASAIVLGTQDASLRLAIDQVAGTLTLSCEPKAPNSKAAQGQINIECGAGGTVNIAAGQGGKVSIDGGSSLALKAQSSITIESTGTVAIKGSKIELN